MVRDSPGSMAPLKNAKTINVSIFELKLSEPQTEKISAASVDRIWKITVQHLITRSPATQPATQQCRTLLAHSC